MKQFLIDVCVFNILRNTMYVYGIVLLFPIIPGCQAATNYAATVKSPTPLTWMEANSYCRHLGGSLLDILSNVKIDPTLDGLFWTAQTITLISHRYSCDRADTRALCGFIQLYENHTLGNVLFGDCNSTRSYVCRDNHNLKVEVRNGTYNMATRYTVHPTWDEIRQLPPGYYWNGETIQYCQLKPTDPPTLVTDSYHVCSVYGRDIGHVYTNCFDWHYAVCLLKPITSETTDSTRHSTSYKETEQSAETSTNTGVKIGVPVAVSLVFICGVILAIVFIRRWQSKNNLPNDDSTLNVRRSRMSGNDYHNQSFEHSGTDRRNIAGNDLYNVCKDSRNNQTLNENDEYCYVKTPEEPEIHIYDHTSQGNEQYDTITPKIQTDIQSDSVYNHLADVEKEDVYVSTIPGKLSRIQESDDVYNILQVGSSMESSGWR